MAQTTGVMNGTQVKVYFGTNEGTAAVVACATDCTFSYSMEARDTTCKDSNGYRTLMEGLRSGSISTNNLFSEDATIGLDEVFGQGRGEVFVMFSASENAGDNRIKFAARVSSIEMNAGTEDNVTWSATFVSSGTITREIIT